MYDDIIQQLRALIRGNVVEEEALYQLLLAHRCVYLARKIKPCERVDIESALSVRERFRLAIPLLHALRDIPYAIIKGAPLSQRIYGSPFLRHSGDIDFLVRRADIDFAKKILLENGFIQGRVVDQNIIPFDRKEIVFQVSLSHQTAPFVKETGNPLCPFISLDLNTSIFWGEYEQPCDMDLVLSNTEKCALFNIPFRRLTPEMEFLALCLHHFKDMNSLYLLSVKGLRLSHFCDLFYYIKNVTLNLEKLCSLSDQLHATPYVYYCLWYTDQLFDAAQLKPYLQVFSSAEGLSLLNTYGLCDAEKHDWAIAFPERLFSQSFSKKFYNGLTEQEREKVRINQTFM